MKGYDWELRELAREEPSIEVEKDMFPKMVEVVYCRDCKFRTLPFEYPTGCHWNQDEEPEAWDYCSAGERRDE